MARPAATAQTQTAAEIIKTTFFFIRSGCEGNGWFGANAAPECCAATLVEKQTCAVPERD